MGEAAERGKEKWPQVRLGDVCDDKITSISSKENFDIIYIDISSIDNKTKCISSYTKIPAKKAPSRAKQILKLNDILVSTVRPNLNAVAINTLDEDTVVVGSTGYCVLRSTEKIENKYLFYFCQSPTFIEQLVKRAKGASYPAVSNVDVKNIQIPLPPLPEQRRIAAVLDQVSSLIALRKAQLAKLDLLVKARFVEMFGDPVKNEMGWEVVQLSKLTTKIGSGATPRGGEESYTSEGISLIRSMNVHNGNFKYEKLAHINNEQAKILENVTVEENDILINITGASVARSCIVPTQILPARVNQHVSIIRCNINRVLPHYLNQLLLNQNYQNLLLSIGGTGGATREAITKQQLEQLPIPLPPLDFQKKFSIFIDMIQMKRHLILSGLNKIDILYKSLSHEYYK